MQNLLVFLITGKGKTKHRKAALKI